MKNINKKDSLNLQKNKKGFSLVETLVALSIFSFAAVLVAGSFSSFLKASMLAKDMQKNMESGRYVLDTMTKTLRNSQVVNLPAPGSDLIAYDYSEGNCVRYQFSSGVVQWAYSAMNSSACTAAVSFSNWTPLSLGGQIAEFLVTGVNIGTSSVERVTIQLGVVGENTSNLERIQTSVSMRN